MLSMLYLGCLQLVSAQVVTNRTIVARPLPVPIPVSPRIDIPYGVGKHIVLALSGNKLYLHDIFMAGHCSAVYNSQFQGIRLNIPIAME